MEDRYLFKAKRIDNGEWVTGQYVNTCYPKDCKKTGHFIVKYPNHLNEIYTSTICQCTGLKDKNGKLIWENDIVNAVSSNSVGEPIYIDGIVVNVTDYNLMLNLYYSDELECVGNKFDNPELLKGGGFGE